jgi:hypothetical protein
MQSPTESQDALVVPVSATWSVTTLVAGHTNVASNGKAVEFVLIGTGSLKVDGGVDGITDANGEVTYTVIGYLAGTKSLHAVDHSDSWSLGKSTFAAQTPSVQLTVG